MSAVRDFLAARDFLLQHRSDYATAYRDFRWPRMEHFNWALDYFDAMAEGNHQPALNFGAEIDEKLLEPSGHLEAEHYLLFGRQCSSHTHRPVERARLHLDDAHALRVGVGGVAARSR